MPKHPNQHSWRALGTQSVVPAGRLHSQPILELLEPHTKKLVLPPEQVLRWLKKEPLLERQYWLGMHTDWVCPLQPHVFPDQQDHSGRHRAGWEGGPGRGGVGAGQRETDHAGGDRRGLPAGDGRARGGNAGLFGCTEVEFRTVGKLWCLHCPVGYEMLSGSVVLVGWQLWLVCFGWVTLWCTVEGRLVTLVGLRNTGDFQRVFILKCCSIRVDLSGWQP